MLGFQHNIVEEMPFEQFQQYYIWPLANCPELFPEKAHTPLAYHLYPIRGVNVGSRKLIQRVARRMITIYNKYITSLESFLVNPRRCRVPLMRKYFVKTERIMEIESLMNLGTIGDFDSFAEQVLLMYSIAMVMKLTPA